MARHLSDISVQYVKGVGPARKRLFANLGVETMEDLLYFFPRRYEDRRNITPIAQLKVGEWQTVTGKVLTHTARKSWHTKKHVTEVTINDGSGRLFCVWFNQPYLKNYFEPEKKVVCYGKVDVYKSRLQMISPEYEIIEGEDEDSLSLSRIVPIYPLTRGITQRYLRKVIYACLDRYKNQLEDELPVPLRNQYKLSNIKRSIESVHFPENFDDQEKALKRISFEEFYFFQISIFLRRLSITQKPGVKHTITDARALEYVHAFDFELTNAQKRVIQEIRTDMQSESPMLRLLQGDVGSGKTLVAFFGCLTAFVNGCQSCIMAPTEILARQHYATCQTLIKKKVLGKLKVALLVSSLKKEERKTIHQGIRDGAIDLVIGTHALITEEVHFKSLSFVVIDEQHKFGVRQRALLSEKGTNPDTLIMTATPIPRTLCITLYGDMDLSLIDEMPKGRGKVKTVLYNQEQSENVYALVREKLKKRDQVYVIYPIIEESQKVDLKAAEAMYKQFQKKEFKGFKVGLVHGQMKKNETASMMDGFKNRKIDILVATTVLEVGIDVPNANVMLVEHAERFGLAQLHQLRGRIGRGAGDGLCILVGEPTTDEGTQRLKALLKTTDGFEIAQQDLMIRGPGRFFGRHQHGLNELKVANPATQLDILELARKEAKHLLEKDPKLKKYPHILNLIKKRYPTYLAMVTAG